MSVSHSKYFDAFAFSHLKSLPGFETLSFNFSYSDSIISFKVPKHGIYMLEAWGASGGGNRALSGAYSVSFVELTTNDVLSILVGEHGWNGFDLEDFIECGGGGGGSFITLGLNPLCVAGGSGSSSIGVYSSSPYAFSCGQSTTIGGNPDTGAVDELRGGKSSGYSAGGGGFEGNGEDSATGGKGGISFINGGHRQESGTAVSGVGYGGFGGGGSNHAFNGYGAGGGGYTGGSASSTITNRGGGGGSYHTGSFQDISSESISGCESFPSNPSGNKDGFVSISLIIEPCNALANTHVSCFSLIQVSFIFYILLHTSSD